MAIPIPQSFVIGSGSDALCKEEDQDRATLVQASVGFHELGLVRDRVPEAVRRAECASRSTWSGTRPGV